MTTIENLTDVQIEKLRAEAMNAGDYMQAFICDIARGIKVDKSNRFLDRDEQERLVAMSKRDARSAVARAINSAEAMVD